MKLKDLKYYISAKIRNMFIISEREMTVLDWLDINHPGEHDHFINSITYWHKENAYKYINNTFNDVIKEMFHNIYPKCIGPLDTIVRDWCFNKAESLREARELSIYELDNFYKCISQLNDLDIVKNNHLLWNKDIDERGKKPRLVLVDLSNPNEHKIIYSKEFSNLWEVSNIIRKYYEELDLYDEKISNCVWNFRKAQQSEKYLNGKEIINVYTTN